MNLTIVTILRDSSCFKGYLKNITEQTLFILTLNSFDMLNAIEPEKLQN